MAKKGNFSMVSATSELTAELRISSWAKFLSTRPRCGLQPTFWWQTTGDRRSSRCRVPCRRSPSSKRPREDGDLRHGTRHRDDLLSPVVCHQKVGCSPHLGRVLRNLAQLEMRNSAVNSDVADTIEKFPFFAISTPRAEKLADAIALFSFPRSATRVVQQLFDQCTVRRESLRTKIGKSQIPDQIRRYWILCKFGDRLFFQALSEFGRLVRILNLPVAERGESVHEVELGSAQSHFEVSVYSRDIRAGNWARGKVQVGKYHGSGRNSWKNLFSNLVIDEGGTSMIYKQVAERSYLVSSDRAKFRTHKMRYPIFEKVMLRLLDDIDYAALTEAATPSDEEQKLQLKDTCAQIMELERLRRRYLRVIEGEEEPDEEIVGKYRAAGVELKKLQTKKELLERAISSTAAPKLNKIPVIEIPSQEECNLRLKDEIRKRVARIQLAFNAQVITAPNPEKVANVRSGKGKIVAQITFTNGAVKWAFIDKDRAVLLS